MKTALVVIESGSKASKLMHALRAYDPLVTWKVQATSGHLRDLPKRDLGIAIDQGFKLAWRTTGHKALRSLKQAAAAASEVYIATDGDREGELIAAHVAQALKIKNVQRLRIYEITVEGVREAFKEIGDLNHDLVAAAEARRALDRLIGYKLSPFCWRGLGGGTSAGRVQSCVLGHILKRDIKRRKHVAEPYHVVEVPISGTKLKACSGRLTDVKAASKIRKALEEATLTNETRIREQKPSAPFHTASALSFMSRTMGASTKDTTRSLQRLYESGLTTYCRTDSVRLSPTFVKTVRAHIQASSPKQLDPDVREFSSADTAQGAHEALRPTSLKVTPSNPRIQSLEPLTRKLYTYLWARTVATQAKPAVYEDTTWKWTDAKGRELITLKTTKVKDRGWHVPSLQLFWQNVVELNGTPKLELKRATTTDHYTEPPPRVGPAEVVRWMEKHGVGRPATYSGILDKLKSYGNVGGSRALGTSLRGEALSCFLEQLVPDLLNPEFTARMEKDLDRIALGKTTYEKVLSHYWAWLEPLLQHTRLKSKAECTTCNQNYIVKVAKNKPPQLVCKCKGSVIWAWGSEKKGFVPHVQSGLDGTCPKCKSTKGFTTVESKRFGVRAKCLSCKTQHAPEAIL